MREENYNLFYNDSVSLTFTIFKLLTKWEFHYLKSFNSQSFQILYNWILKLDLHSFFKHSTNLNNFSYKELVKGNLRISNPVASFALNIRKGYDEFENAWKDLRVKNQCTCKIALMEKNRVLSIECNHSHTHKCFRTLQYIVY